MVDENIVHRKPNCPASSVAAGICWASTWRVRKAGRRHKAEDGVEDGGEAGRDVGGEEAQDAIGGGLEEEVLATGAAVGFGI